MIPYPCRSDEQDMWSTSVTFSYCISIVSFLENEFLIYCLKFYYDLNIDVLLYDCGQIHNIDVYKFVRNVVNTSMVKFNILLSDIISFKCYI